MLNAHRLNDITRDTPITIEINGKSVTCYEGETLITALLAAGIGIFRLSSNNQPRAPYCNMGVCFDCMVTVDGKRYTRACMTDVRAGMRVNTESTNA